MIYPSPPAILPPVTFLLLIILPLITLFPLQLSSLPSHLSSPSLHRFPSFPFHPPFPPPPTLPSSIPPSQHMPSDSSRRLTKQYLDIHEDSLGLAILFGTVNNSRLKQ